MGKAELLPNRQRKNGIVYQDVKRTKNNNVINKIQLEIKSFQAESRTQERGTLGRVGNKETVTRVRKQKIGIYFIL